MSISLTYITYTVVAIVAYLFGSISFGIIFSKLVLHDDIRNHGSGNTGMTNALRSYGKKAAIFIFIGDFLKGYLGAIAVQLILKNTLATAIACIFILLGHMYPIFFGFRGGKGIATAAGIIMFTDPIILAILLTIFFIIVIFTKYISAGSVCVAILYPISTTIKLKLANTSLTADDFAIIFMTIVVCAIVLFRHKDNIKRLCSGTENKFSVKNNKK